MERWKTSWINSSIINLIRFSLIFLFIVFTSCFNLKFQKEYIISNQWQGQKIRIAKLGDDYKKQYRINKMFSKFSSSRLLPYYKFIDKEFIIIGSYIYNKQNYLIINDKKQSLFKFPLRKNAMPSFIVFDKTLKNADLPEQDVPKG